MVRYGRQTVSVDVDTGVLLFDRKAGSFGTEKVSHDRSKQTLICYQPQAFLLVPVTFSLLTDLLYNVPLWSSPAAGQDPEQSGQGVHGG